MESIALTFGTQSRVTLSVSSVRDNYEKQYFLPIVIEEDGPYSYMVHIFGANNLESVFPIFKVTETSYLKFAHNGRLSSYIKVPKDTPISSFSNKNDIYNLEICNEKRQPLPIFEKCGYYKRNTLIVWFGLLRGEDDREIYTGTNYTLIDNKLVFGHPDYNTDSYFDSKIMNKRIFHFCFT